MKLIGITSRFYMILFLVILGIWSLIFFFVFKYEIYENIDDNLLRKNEEIVNELKRGQYKIDENFYKFSDFRIEKLDKSNYQSGFFKLSDTLIYEPFEHEYYEFRYLLTFYRHNNDYFRITILRPSFETNELVRIFAFIIAALYIIIVIALVLSSAIMTKRIWKPFYRILDKIRHYNLEKHEALNLPETNIDEFKELNKSLTSLTENNFKTYQSQKQFIENASHEMQTPLAIIQSKCELIYQQKGLTNEMAQEVEKIQEASNRLSKMNQSLLLLSKIENNQFSEKTQEDLSAYITRILEFFEDIKEQKNIELITDLQENQIVLANPILLEILLTNLVKNAFVHNVINGVVEIHSSANKLEIINTRPKQNLQEEKLFSRFGKQGDNKDGLGLGLSIVKKICDVHDWTVRHTLEETKISFSIIF